MPGNETRARECKEQLSSSLVNHGSNTKRILSSSKTGQSSVHERYLHFFTVELFRPFRSESAGGDCTRLYKDCLEGLIFSEHFKD